MRRVGSDAELHEAVNAGHTELEAVPNEHFELLRTWGRARPPIGDPQPERLDLIRVTAEGVEPYLAANAVLAGHWAEGTLARRRRLRAVMGERVLELAASSLAVCNGQFAAPARWIAPRAHPADGRLAVLVDGNRPWRARALARRMVLGEHVPDRLVHQLRPTELWTQGPSWALEADGIKGRGRLPARFEIVPLALTLWM